MRKFLYGFFLLMFVAGCGQNQSKADKKFKEAEAILKSSALQVQKSNDLAAYQPALDAYQEIVDRYPDSPSAADSLFVISNILIQQRKYNDAAERLQKVIRQFSSLPEKVADARHGLAALNESLGKWPQAEANYWELAEMHPLFQKASYAPVHILFHYQKSNDKASQDKTYAKGVQYFQKMIQQAGKNSAVVTLKNNYALFELAQGNWQAARNIFAAIAADYPKVNAAPMALLAAAELSVKQGETDKAMEFYQRYFKDYPNHTLAAKTSVELGSLFLQKKDYAKAIEWFQKAVEATKNNPDALAEAKMFLGRGYQAQGNWDQAEKIYQEVLKQYPNSIGAMQIPFAEAEYYKSVNQPEKAKQILMKALEGYLKLEREAKTPQARALAERFQSTVYSQLEDWNSLIALIDRGMARETSAYAKGNLMLVKASVLENRVKDSGKALEIYQQFLKAFSTHPMADFAKKRVEALSKPA